MASIPHPLQLHIAMLLVQAQTHLPTRTRMRLSFVLWAILLSGTVVQRQVARTLASISPNDAHASSHERRLRRAIADRRLCWETGFAPLVRFVLRNVTGSVTVLVDESGHTDVVRVLTAALWYQGRAIPLAWIVWKGQTPHETAYWDDCQRLLGRVDRVLPPGVCNRSCRPGLWLSGLSRPTGGAWLAVCRARARSDPARTRGWNANAYQEPGQYDHATVVGSGAGVQEAGLA